jgi:hypothetical protein
MLSLVIKKAFIQDGSRNLSDPAIMDAGKIHIGTDHHNTWS